MRLKIDTTGIEFRAGGPARPKSDYRDKDQQAMTPDGRPIWLLKLTAYDMAANDGAGSSETFWAEVAGDKPEVTAGALVQIGTLVFAPWISGPERKDHKIVRNFRADTVTAVPANGKAAVHAA